MSSSNKIAFLKTIFNENKSYTREELTDLLLLKNQKELTELCYELVLSEVNKEKNLQKYVYGLKSRIEQIFENNLDNKLANVLEKLDQKLDSLIKDSTHELLVEAINTHNEELVKSIVNKNPNIVNCTTNNRYLYEVILDEYYELCKSNDDIEEIKYYLNVIKIFNKSKNFRLNKENQNAINIIDKIKKSNKRASSYYLENLKTFLFKEKETIQNINDKYKKTANFSKAAYKEIEGLQCDNCDFVDLRGLYTITIDNFNTVEIDDAISIKPLSNGNKLLFIHVSNPYNYIKLNTVLQKEAYKRTETIYLNDRALFMFPFESFDSLFSLKKNCNRFSNSVVFELNKKHEVVSSKFVNAIIKVDENYTYNEVEKLLKNGNLIELKELTENLSNEEIKNSKELIRNLMGFVNSECAKTITNLKYPFIYRVQLELDEVLSPNLSEFFIKNGISKKELSKIFSKPFYSHENLGHFSKKGPYCRITSPIRNYPDYLNQMIISECLIKKADDKTLIYLEDVVCNSIQQINTQKEENEKYVEEYNKVIEKRKKYDKF